MKTWSAGDIVAFPLPNGVHALIWVLDVIGDGYVIFLVLDGYWPSCPSEQNALDAQPSKPLRPILPDEDNVWKGCINGPPALGFKVVGRRQPGEVEAGYVKNYTGTMIFGSPERLQDEIYVMWRLKHDNAQLKAEWEAERLARIARAEERRKSMTLPKMLKERIFSHWAEHWPKPVVREARRIFKDATNELIELQQSGTEAQRIAVLKRIVTEFNALYDKTGCVETGEREEIVARISELAARVGLNNDNECLTGHRDW